MSRGCADSPAAGRTQFFYLSHTSHIRYAMPPLQNEPYQVDGSRARLSTGSHSQCSYWGRTSMPVTDA
jgi:hypothetical protein